MTPALVLCPGTLERCRPPVGSTPGVARCAVLGTGLVAAAFLAVPGLRRWYAWPAAGLLTGALWLRLGLSGLTTLEWYTVPPAFALLGWGALRLRSGHGQSLTTLLPGPLLGPGGSWVLALRDPTSLRALLVGLALLGCLVVGSLGRLVAPLLVGALGLSVLVVAELWPLAAYLPRWVLVAAGGVLLVGLGVTWEARLCQLRRLGGLVGRMR